MFSSSLKLISVIQNEEVLDEVVNEMISAAAVEFARLPKSEGKG